MQKNIEYTEIKIEPFGFVFPVFIDKIFYANYCKANNLWDKPQKEEISLQTNLGEVSYSKKTGYLELAVYLPKITDVKTLDFEEIIDHELMHVIFLVYKHFGVGVNGAPEFHEMFCWHHNHLDRQIMTKVYKRKNIKQ